MGLKLQTLLLDSRVRDKAKIILWCSGLVDRIGKENKLYLFGKIQG